MAGPSLATTSFFRPTRCTTRGQGQTGIQQQITNMSSEIENQDDLQIVNLSSVTLSLDEIGLLKKGLSFTPTPSFDVFTWVIAVNLFARKPPLKYHSIDNSSWQEIAITILEELQRENESGSLERRGSFSSLKT